MSKSLSESLFDQLAAVTAERDKLRTENSKLQLIVDSRTDLLEECLALIDPADDGKRSRYAAGAVPCLVYGGLPGAIKGLLDRLQHPPVDK
jgi:hypothetical protein